MHAYLAQRYSFPPLPHVPVGIQNATASEKTKDPSLHKESTGSQTLAYGLLPKGLTAMLLTPSCVCRGTGGGRGPRRWDGRGGGGAGEGGGEGGGRMGNYT